MRSPPRTKMIITKPGTANHRCSINDPALASLRLGTTVAFKSRLEDREEERKREDLIANEVQLKIISGLFRNENVKYKGDQPPEQKRRWLHVYHHPAQGLKGMTATSRCREIYNLPPDQRVAHAIAQRNAWLIEELALRGHACDVPNVRNVRPQTSSWLTVHHDFSQVRLCPPLWPAMLSLEQASGYTPLHMAARFDYYECVTVLLTVGCDVNVQTEMGFTPLYVAVASGAKHAAMLLEEAGGLQQVPVKPLPGYRSVVDDDKWPRPRHARRALDEKAMNIHRRAYVGQF